MQRSDIVTSSTFTAVQDIQLPSYETEWVELKPFMCTKFAHDLHLAISLHLSTLNILASWQYREIWYRKWI